MAADTRVAVGRNGLLRVPALAPLSGCLSRALQESMVELVRPAKARCAEAGYARGVFVIGAELTRGVASGRTSEALA
jgi:hypothetical protein